MEFKEMGTYIVLSVHRESYATTHKEAFDSRVLLDNGYLPNRGYYLHGY